MTSGEPRAHGTKVLGSTLLVTPERVPFILLLPFSIFHI